MQVTGCVLSSVTTLSNEMLSNVVKELSTHPVHLIQRYFRQRRHLIVHCPYSIGVLSITALATSSAGIF